MRVLPIHRLQSYFRELEIQEAARNTEPLPVYFGGPGELCEALLAEGHKPEHIPEAEPVRIVYRVENNGNNLIMWLAVGVLVALHLWRW
jgi:hypothetical protein